MKAGLIAITGIILVLLSVSTFAVHAQTEGYIEGWLVNGTESGSSTSGQSVILTTYLDDIERNTRNTLTDDNGMFLFEGLDTAPGYSYQVKTTFLSADYYSEDLEFVEGSENLSVALPVYDSTESDADISIMSSHVIIYVEEEDVFTTEFYLFHNNSDLTYIGTPYSENMSKRETFRLSLPQNAENLQIESESADAYIQSASGDLIYTRPVQPGTKEVAFSYMTEYAGGTYTYTQDVFVPINNMELLINGDVTIAPSEFMVRNEPFQSQGATFQHFTATDVAPGEQLSLVLTESSSTGSKAEPFWIIIIIILVIIAAYLMYYLRKKKKVASMPTENDDVEELLNIIAGLDDDFESGIIDENEYQELRDKYKNRLADLMEKSDGD